MVDNPIVLGVDLDEVVFKYIEGLRAWGLSTHGITFPSGEPKCWSLKDAGWFGAMEEYFQLHGEAVEQGLYEQLELIEGARKMLWDLSDSGYEINIITARFVNPGQHQKVVSQTVKALDKHHIPYSNISFLSNKVLQYADAYIDDSPKNIQGLTEAGRFVIAYTMEYNKHLEAPARATSWPEVREILRQKFGR